MSSLEKRKSLFPSSSSFFDDFFSRDFFDWNDKNFSATGTTLPSVNVKETDSNFNIELAAPGMSKSDFKIELKNNVLSISSEKKEENEEKDDEGNYTRKEFSYQSFSRSFRVPENAKQEDVSAKYDNGILTVSLAKKEIEAKPESKTIDVK